MSFAGPTSSTVNTMIRIAGIGDHNQPEWLITINGMRSLHAELALKRPLDGLSVEFDLELTQSTKTAEVGAIRGRRCET